MCQKREQQNGTCWDKFALFSAVGNIDTSGISMFEELKKTTDRRGLKVQTSFSSI